MIPTGWTLLVLGVISFLIGLVRDTTVSSNGLKPAPVGWVVVGCVLHLWQPWSASATLCLGIPA
jgi:hypothetical protein